MLKTVNVGRRAFLGGTGKSVLSATAVALLAGCESMAKNVRTIPGNADSAQDVAILNTALSLEHEAIAAYQLGAESGLLAKPVLQTAVLFQSQHKEHRDALASTVKLLGGVPADSESLEDYAAALGAGGLKNQTDVLRLAARLEKGAANAYLGVIPAFSDADLAQVSGRLAADETMHWTVLASALGENLPVKALSFGA